MKIIRKLKWVLLVILISVAGAWLNENFVHYYISKTLFYSILIFGIPASIFTRFIQPVKKLKLHGYLLSFIISLLLITYLGLIIGHSDIFAKDQAGLGLTVKEVRFKIVKIEFKKESEDVWETNLVNKEALLYPGKNWVWMGRQELGPVGYDRERGIMETATDILWDQNLVIQEHPDWIVPAPENNSDVVKSENLGEGKYLVTFFRREEFERPLLRPAGTEGQSPPSVPVYPDVGLDVIIGEDGRVARITLHPLLPEPFGELTIEVPTGNL